MRRLELGKVLAFTLLMIFTIISIFPYYITIIMSTHVSEDLYKGIKLLPGHYFMQNLKSIMKVNFFVFYQNSLLTGLLVVICGTLVSSMAGFGFSKNKSRFSRRVFIFVLASMMLPGQLGLIGYMIEMRVMGLSNTLLSISLPLIANSFSVFFMKQFIDVAIYDSIVESARLDGCSNLSLYARIIMPNIKPALFTVALLLFLQSWNDYLTPLVMLNNEDKYTVQLGLILLNSEYRNDYAASIGALVLATIPISIFFMLNSKHLIRGLMAGSVKG